MEITIKIEDLSEDQLRQRFEVIKRTAYNKRTLPEDFEADSIDRDYCEKIKRVYENFRLQIKTEEESKQEIELYFNTYKTDKGISSFKLNTAKADLEKNKKTGQIERKMITLDFDTYQEAENLLYAYFEVTRNSVTANSLKPFVEYLKTGCKPQKEVTEDDQHDNADGETCS